MAHEDDNQELACNAVILAKKNATFLKRLYDAYQSYNGSCWGCHSVVMPGRLALIYPREVEILPTRTFFRPSWNEMSKFYESNDYNFSSNYAAHLWSKVSNHLDELTASMALCANTTFGRMIRQAVGNSTLLTLDRISSQHSSHPRKKNRRSLFNFPWPAPNTLPVQYLQKSEIVTVIVLLTLSAYHWRCLHRNEQRHIARKEENTLFTNVSDCKSVRSCAFQAPDFLLVNCQKMWRDSSAILIKERQLGTNTTTYSVKCLSLLFRRSVRTWYLSLTSSLPFLLTDARAALEKKTKRNIASSIALVYFEFFETL